MSQESRRFAVSQGKADKWKIHEKTTDKLQAGSRGGPRITVERFTIIFLEVPIDIHAEQ